VIELLEKVRAVSDKTMKIVKQMEEMWSFHLHFVSAGRKSVVGQKTGYI